MSHKWLKFHSTPSCHRVRVTWEILVVMMANGWYERRDTFYRSFSYRSTSTFLCEDGWHDSSMNVLWYLMRKYWKSICMTRFIFLTLFVTFAVFILYTYTVEKKSFLWWDFDYKPFLNKINVVHFCFTNVDEVHPFVD